MVRINKKLNSLGGNDDISSTSTGNNKKYCNILSNDNNKHPKTTNNNEIIPNEYDVLCVKDKTFAKHIGNQIFQNIIKKYALSYAIASKHDKMKLTSFIVNHMKQYQSRFLRLINNNIEIAKDTTTAPVNNNPHTDEHVKSKQQQPKNQTIQKKNHYEWEIITEKQARDKASHALRFASKQQQMKKNKWNISCIGTKKDYSNNNYNTKWIKKVNNNHELALLQPDQINITTSSRIFDDANTTSHNINLEHTAIQNEIKISENKKMSSKFHNNKSTNHDNHYVNVIVFNASDEKQQDDDDDDDVDDDNDSISVETTESFVDLYNQQQDMLKRMKEAKQNQFQNQQHQQQEPGIDHDDNINISKSQIELQNPIERNNDIMSNQCYRMIDGSCRMMNQTQLLQTRRIAYNRSNRSEYSLSMRSSSSNIKQLDGKFSSSSTTTHDNILQISSSLSSSIHSNNKPGLSKYSSSRRFTSSIGDDIVRLLDMSIMTLESI